MNGLLDKTRNCHYNVNRRLIQCRQDELGSSKGLMHMSWHLPIEHFWRFLAEDSGCVREKGPAGCRIRTGWG